MKLPFEYSGPNAPWIWAGFIVIEILWLWSVVTVAKEKTPDPYDRIVWLLIVLMLNFVGTLLYFFFAASSDSPKPQEKKKPDYTKIRSEAELKQSANNGTL